MNTERYSDELNALQANHNLRQLQSMEFISPTVAKIDGREYLIMNSNNYLGLTYHPRLIAAGIGALQKYGTGSTGSRLTTGSFNLFKQLEDALAEFKKTEAALVFNTGFTTNLGVISTLLAKGDYLLSDELNHASIIDGCRSCRAEKFIYPHKNMQVLEHLLAKLPYSSTKLIVTDGVFSMDGDIAPLEEIVFLADKYNALVMVDDAHGTGVIGKGHGTAAHFNLQDKIALQMGTLSKALASVGGFIATKKIFVDYLINKARPFIFSTALTPADIAAAHAAVELIKSDESIQGKLEHNISDMKDLLSKEGILCPTETAIFPLIVGDNATALKIAQELYDEKIILSAIRPPTVPVGQSRLRLTVTAAHSHEQLDKTAALLGQLWRKYKL